MSRRLHRDERTTPTAPPTPSPRPGTRPTSSRTEPDRRHERVSPSCSSRLLPGVLLRPQVDGNSAGVRPVAGPGRTGSRTITRVSPKVGNRPRTWGSRRTSGVQRQEGIPRPQKCAGDPQTVEFIFVGDASRGGCGVAPGSTRTWGTADKDRGGVDSTPGHEHVSGTRAHRPGTPDVRASGRQSLGPLRFRPKRKDSSTGPDRLVPSFRTHDETPWTSTPGRPGEWPLRRSTPGRTPDLLPRLG